MVRSVQTTAFPSPYSSPPHHHHHHFPFSCSFFFFFLIILYLPTSNALVTSMHSLLHRVPLTLTARNNILRHRHYSFASPTSFPSSSPPSSSPPSTSPPHKYSIKITPSETALFKLLTDVCLSSPSTQDTVLRVAGGWVRDKLIENDVNGIKKPDVNKKPVCMCVTSHTHTPPLPSSSPLPSTSNPDIDIALSNILGLTFAHTLNTYLSNTHQEPLTIGVIHENPSKSKHLETATVKIEDNWIDFVNLRAETYAVDDVYSRTPKEMRLGTPFEDSSRRDLTVNSLFYNLHSKEIEDFTGKGLSDLEGGIIRTPLAPLRTLMDDPLRVLRAVRFAARLEFVIDDELHAAACDGAVHDALSTKVSRERVGKEVDLMVGGRDPVRALRLVTEMGLCDVVFESSSSRQGQGERLPSQRLRGDYVKGLSILTNCHQFVNSDFMNGYVNTSNKLSRRLLWYACYLMPFSTSPIPTPIPLSSNLNSNSNNKHQKNSKGLVYSILTNDLKGPTADGDHVIRIQACAHSFTALIHDLEFRDEDDSLDGVVSDMDVRCRIAMIMRRAGFAVGSDDAAGDCEGGALWIAGFALSFSECLVAHHSNSNSNGDEAGTKTMTMTNKMTNEMTNEMTNKYKNLLNLLTSQNLPRTFNVPPIYSGKLLQTEILPKLTPGPLFKGVVEAQVEWMLRNPEGEGEELRDFLRGAFVEFC